jgi:porphobilinogen deaminase
MGCDMTDESEPAVKRQKRISPLAKANREAFKAARMRAEKTTTNLEATKELRTRFQEIHERAVESQVEQGPLVPVEAQMEVEEEGWVYQSVDEETLRELSHRVVLHTSAGKRKVLFETQNLNEAMDCAARIVEFSDGCVLVETIDP